MQAKKTAITILLLVLGITLTACHTQLGTVEKSESGESAKTDRNVAQDRMSNTDQSYYFIDYATHRWFYETQVMLSAANDYQSVVIIDWNSIFYRPSYFYQSFFTSLYNEPFCTASGCYSHSVNGLGSAFNFGYSNLLYGDSSAYYDPLGRFDPLNLHNYTLANNLSYSYFRNLYYRYGTRGFPGTRFLMTARNSERFTNSRSSDHFVSARRAPSRSGISHRSGSKVDSNTVVIRSTTVRSRRSSIGDRGSVRSRTSGIQSRGRNTSYSSRRAIKGLERRNASGERRLRNRSDRFSDRRDRSGNKRTTRENIRYVKVDETVHLNWREIIVVSNTERAINASKAVIRDRTRTVDVPQIQTNFGKTSLPVMSYDKWLRDVASQYRGNRSSSVNRNYMRNSRGRSGSVTRTAGRSGNGRSTVRSRSSSGSRQGSSSTIKRTRSSSDGSSRSRSRSSSSNNKRSSGSNN